MASDDTAKANRASSQAGGTRSSRGRRRPTSDQRFSTYLSFGFHATACLSIFLGLYIVILLGLSPLLHQEAPTSIPTRRGEVLRPVVQHTVEQVKHHLPHVPGQLVAEEVVSLFQHRLATLRRQQDTTDADLLLKASQEFQARKSQQQQKLVVPSAANAAAAAGVGAAHVDTVARPVPGQRTGFMVLGMHRSGTSMLSGLLVQGLGYHVGSPLIGGSFDNEKGFFELIPVVLQNDVFMNHQKVWWSANVVNYDANLALQAKKDGKLDFGEHGDKAIAFLNNPGKAPWLQKDPRMCITLKTWLPLLNNEPAIVFTYRHPLEVATSLKKREANFSLERGLRLWIIYNMRALQNSAGLCRITSSNTAVLANPLQEVQRIADDLTTKCHVPKPARDITQDDVDKFVDPNLQHNKKKDEAGAAVLETHNDGACVVRDFVDPDALAGSALYEREKALYRKAMKMYCDLESGAAYKDDYVWPEL